MHTKCRYPNAYPRSDVKRFEVPDELVPWSKAFQEYKPTEFTASSVLAKPVWADPDLRFGLFFLIANSSVKDEQVNGNH